MFVEPSASIGPPRLSLPAEAFLAELTDAAYQTALRHGIKGNFIDLQLEIWAALRQVVAQELLTGEPAMEEGCPCCA